MSAGISAALAFVMCVHAAHGRWLRVCPNGYTANSQSCGSKNEYTGTTYRNCQSSGWEAPSGSDPRCEYWCEFSNASRCENFCSDCSGGIAIRGQWDGRRFLWYNYCCDKIATTAITTTVTTTVTPAPAPQLPLQFEPVEGGFGRACRSKGGGNAASNYVLRTGVASIWDCQAQCIAENSTCNAIEYNIAFDGGRCEAWTEAVENGPVESVRSPGFMCLRYNSQGVAFQAVDGGHDRACRAQGGLNSPSYYELRSQIPTVFVCESLCVEMSSCVGIEYHDNGRCELWKVDSQVRGIQSTAVKMGYTCLRMAGHLFDERMHAV